MIVLAADPGASGGLALIDAYVENRPPQLISGIMMPVIEAKSKKTFDWHRAEQWFLDHTAADERARGVIENVHSMRAQGVASSFQFGRMFGVIEAFMSWAVGIKNMTWVEPGTWKKAMHLNGTASASIFLAEKEFGAEAKQKYFPLKKHDGIAEAALMGLYYIRSQQTKK